LVTYNSEETDPAKQQLLLDEVVNQVRQLRGSPARMLFILNRIDVFRRDPDFEIHTENFIKNTIQKICNSVAKALPEYEKQAGALKAKPLSTYPALCAYQALNNSEELSIEGLKRIDSKFNFLIPESIIDELPRNISKWKDADRKKVAEAVWHSSFAYNFDETLRQHIQDNIPQLLLPHLIKTVLDSVNESLTNAHQITHARLNATNDRYQKQCDHLTKIGLDLQKLRKKSKHQLLQSLLLFEQDDDDDDEYKSIIDLMSDVARELEKTYQMPKFSLEPLHDWSIQLGKTIDAFFNSINKAIIAGSNKPKGEIFDSLPPQQREKISQILEDLFDLGYIDYANKGGLVETDSEYKKDNLRQMNSSLNNLSKELSDILKSVLDRTSEREAERIQDSLQLLIKAYATLINKEAQLIAIELAGLTITPLELLKVKKKFLLNFQLKAGFLIKEEEKEVDTGRTKKVKKGTKTVKKGTKRLWYTCFFKKIDIYEEEDIFTTKTIYEKRSYDAAMIPSATDIFSIFIEQAKSSRHEIEFVRWLSSQLNGFLEGIELYQENLLKEYRRFLDKAMNEAKQEKEVHIGKWQPISDNIGDLLKKMPELLKVI
ncbi:MAG: hypothetical protein HQK65_13010, partial [Desulfamplus sp.]|nr:hypothetical protein [Desulfamplus sp.]